jgi:hypothetical protein
MKEELFACTGEELLCNTRFILHRPGRRASMYGFR